MSVILTLVQNKTKDTTQTWVVGIDEVGRGPIAGPVTVCAVAMKTSDYKKARWTGLTDSKKLTRPAREKWSMKAHDLQTTGKLRIAIVSQAASAIDKRGISACIKACIKHALVTLDLDPTHTLVLLDGSIKAPMEYSHQKTVIKGDQKHKIISLASVVAKVARDAYMTNMAQKYPGYGWESNMGYGTQTHYQALKKLGFTRLHRKSFLRKVLDNKS